MPPATTTSSPIIIITKNTGPQSFSLLMNFQCDGTSLVQILKENSFYWADNGRCSHGRVYDPATGRCRDVFCATGYTLTSQGCTKEAMNSTKLEQVKKRDEIRVDLSLAHDLCLYEIDVNETEVCGHSLLSNDLSVFIDEFRDGLSHVMDVDATRFGEIRVKSRLLVNEKLSANYTLTSERFEVSLTISKNEGRLEADTLYFWLISLALERRGVSVGRGHVVNLVRVVEAVNSTMEADDWCNDDGDSEKFYNSKKDVRVLGEFDSNSAVKYYVYVKETGQLYQTGLIQNFVCFFKYIIVCCLS
jgi:hypothetical protein